MVLIISVNFRIVMNINDQYFCNNYDMKISVLFVANNIGNAGITIVCCPHN